MEEVMGGMMEGGYGRDDGRGYGRDDGVRLWEG